MELRHKNKLAAVQLVGWLALLTAACGGCAAPYHFFHYHQPFAAVAESNKTYFHSSQTGRIIPKDPCDTYFEPGCFGFEPTCWTQWPDCCPGNCPVLGEVEVEVLSDVPTAELDGRIIEPQSVLPSAANQQPRFEQVQPTAIRSQANRREPTPASRRVPSVPSTGLEYVEPLAGRPSAIPPMQTSGAETEDFAPHSVQLSGKLHTTPVINTEREIGSPALEVTSIPAPASDRASLRNETKGTTDFPGLSLSESADKIDKIVPARQPLVERVTGPQSTASPLTTPTKIAKSRVVEKDSPDGSTANDADRPPTVDVINLVPTTAHAKSATDASNATKSKPDPLEDAEAKRLATGPAATKPSDSIATTTSTSTSGIQSPAVEQKDLKATSIATANRLPHVTKSEKRTVASLTTLAELPEVDVAKSGKMISVSTTESLRHPIKVSAGNVEAATLKFATDNQRRQPVRIGTTPGDNTIRFR